MSESLNLLQGPEPVETADLHFKLIGKLRVFESNVKFDNGKYSLIAVSHYYGLIFIGNLDGFSVLQSKFIKASTDFNQYPRKNISLGLRPTQILTDFSQKFLAVACNSQSGSVLYIYSIISLGSEEFFPLKVFHLSKLVQNLSAEVSEILWQPNADGIIMVCLSDGSVLSINPNAQENATHILASTTQAKCFCWSPKGKQIVIGCNKGNLSQYKPDLKFVKTISAPPFYNGNVMVTGVFWISNYQFAAFYNERNNSASSPVFAIVNAVKNEPISVVNYDDITYYGGHLLRQHQIYFSHQNEWNLIFISSANSIEVAVLHCNNASWEQLLLGDASRAELPLNSSRQETFPIGMAFDLSSTESIPWGENTVPPMPHLLLLSNEGVLCFFNVVNLTAHVPQICGPPKEYLSDSLFTITQINSLTAATNSDPVLSSAAVVPAVSEAPIQTSKFYFGGFENFKPGFVFGSNMNSETLSFQPQNNISQATLSIPNTCTVSETKEISQLEQQKQNQTAKNNSLNLTLSQDFSQKETTGVSLFGTSTTPAFTFSLPVTNSSPATSKIILNQQNVFEVSTVLLRYSSSTKENENKATAKGFTSPPNISLTQSVPFTSNENSNLKSVPEKNNLKEKADEILEESSNEVKNLLENTSSAVSDLPVVDDKVYLNALNDEIDHFNSELKLLSEKIKNIDFQVGTPEDREKLRNTMEELHVFWKELKETTLSQSAEIHTVVTDLMESFAWLEDAKSRNIQRKNPSFIELKKSEELDPINARHMSEIGHLKYYIENQLKQLTSYLEKEWMNHQDSYRLQVKNQMVVPSLEEIYKTMHFQLKILSIQRTLVEELKNKMATKKRQNKLLCSFTSHSSSSFPSTHGSNRVVELSKLADNLLQLKINKEKDNSALDNSKEVHSQIKIIHDRSKKLTLDKQMALRDVLSERSMVKIRPVKTNYESSSFLRSLILKKSAQKMDNKEINGSIQEKDKEKLSSLSIKSKTIVSSKHKTEAKPKENANGFLLQSDNREELKTEQEFIKTDFISQSINAKEKLEIPVKTTCSEQTTSLQNEEKLQRDLHVPVVSYAQKDLETTLTKTSNHVTSEPPPSTFNSGLLQHSKVASENFFIFSANEKKQPEKPEESKTVPMFTFGLAKSEETKKSVELPKSNEKVNFGVEPLNFTFSKQEPSKPVIPKISSSSVVTSSFTSTSASSPFTFSFAPNTSTTSTFSTTFTTSAGLPKMNVSLSTKEQKSELTTTTTHSTGTTFTTSFNFTFTSNSNIFGNAKTAISTSTVSSAVTTSQTSFTFLSTINDQKTIEPDISETKKNSKVEKNEVKSGSINEPEKAEESKIIPKPLANLSFGTSSAQTITTPSINSPQISISQAQPASSSQNSPGVVTNFFSQPAVITTVAPTSSLSAGQIKGMSTVSSGFSFNASKSNASIFGQVASPTNPVTETSKKPIEKSSPSIIASVTALTTSTTTTITATTVTTTIATTSTALFSTACTNTVLQQTTTTSAQEKSSTVPSTSIFGSGTMTTNIFGGSVAPVSKPIFAQNSISPPQTTGNIFGGSSSLTSATNTFGQSTPQTSSSSAFNDSVTKTTNIFGQLLSESNQMNNLFVTSTTTASTTNLFSTQKNIFGNAATTASTGSIFGGTNTSLFAQSSSPFGGQPVTTSTIFSQTPTSNSFFGQNICSPFSASSSATSNQNSLEGGGFGNKPIFGQSSFNQMTSSTPLFGSSLFGGVSNSSSTGTNVFQTTNSFGGAAPGPFSSNQGSVAETGFKAVNTFQQPLGGFGSPPVFGSGPSSTSGFGMAPTFSSAPLFGSQATFGSVPGVFDSNQGTFGQSQGHSTTFENLANQNTVGFGNLAQQSQQSQGFGRFNSTPAFENKAAFGGSSFSNWRSK